MNELIVNADGGSGLDSTRFSVAFFGELENE
jgi:hypothetical protein